jgi:hypothetical protein
MANSEVVEGGESSLVPSSDNEGNSVSLKVYQDIYNQITGKSEESAKKYKDPILLCKSDIEELHYKIEQLFDVHEIVAKNALFVIHYDQKRKDQFSSFEKFQNFSKQSTESVKGVIINYNFSLRLPGITRPQEYSVRIRFQSRLAMLKELREDAPTFMHGPLINMLTSETAEIRVEYVDYVVARGFLEVFREWIAGVEKCDEVKFIKKIQAYSHFLPPIGKMIIALLYGYFIYNSIDTVFEKAVDLAIFAKFSSVAAVSFYLSIILSNVFFKAMERSIDSYSGISWIKLTKGDDNLIKAESKKQKRNAGIFILNSIFTIVLGVLSGQISTFLQNLT